MMKALYVVLILIAFQYKIYAQDNNDPFVKMDYDSIVIYDFDPLGESVEESSIITKKNKLISTIKRRKTLTQNESHTLSGMLGLTSSYGELKAACFEPHLGMVYYKNGKILVHLTICMNCNTLISSMHIPNQAEQRSVNGTVYYNLDGMSKSLRMHLNTLLQKYEFSHIVED